MKADRTEIMMGTQELVAVGRRTLGTAYCRPATVQAMRQPRTVYTGGGKYSYRGRTVNDGVQVQYENGKTEIVAPANIISTWGEYNDALTAEKERRAKKDTAQQDREARRAQLSADLDINIQPYYSRHAQGYEASGYEVVVRESDLNKLRDRIAELEGR
jgi:hypothetical protein